MMRALLLAALVSGCGGAPANGKDLAMAADQATPRDLAMGDMPPEGVPDLLVADLAETPDLAQPAADLTMVGGDGGHGTCPSMAGYAGMGMNGRLSCGLSGMCNGMSYTMDCDGNTCVCAIDKVIVAMLPQLVTCDSQMNMDKSWSLGCGF
jgi:hypothetical protein